MILEDTLNVLKPCPFCGGCAIIVYCVHSLGGDWAIECTKNHRHRIGFCKSMDEAIKKWNEDRRWEND